MMEIGSRMATHANLKSLMKNFIDFMEANTKKQGPSHNFPKEPGPTKKWFGKERDYRFLSGKNGESFQ